ncbi:YdeI/OmpD-associated family protein [Clostridium baratii]|uniref:YdeI/OmpD-associated family protein n=1 Tax=Clostridium baratii TaxID=1561 RepID=UPI0006BAB4B8|nr:YdeI/OmpD-associated family protein [Clostridium baratii]
MQKFEAKLKKVQDKNASYIEIPFDVLEVYGSKRVKVKATRGSLVKMGTDCHIIGVTKEIRDKINKTFGDTVYVTLEKDIEERTVEIPDDFKSELQKNISANDFFNTLSFSYQKKYINYITSAKKDVTRNNRIIKSIEKLTNKEKL